MTISQALRAGSRTLYPSAELTLTSGETVALTAADILSLEIQEGADSALTPGNVISASCSLTLDNAGGRWLPLSGETSRLEGATAALTLNVWVEDAWQSAPMGVFVIDAVSAAEQRPEIRLSGCDSIATELGGAFEDALEYPAALSALWAHAVGQTRYQWQGTVPNGDAVIDARPDWGDTSLRAALGWIAAAAGCFVQLDREGALKLSPCRRDAADADLTPESYMALTRGFDRFGPVSGLRVLPAPDALGEQTPLEVTDETIDGSETLLVERNPLFMQGAAHLAALARGMLAQLSGMALAKADFRWRGDPAVGVGARLALTDTRGETHLVTVTRQTLRFDGGFSATCACETPDRGDSGVLRAITPEGGVNAGALVGVVDGGLLKAGSVMARSIAAGSISAQHLAAGAVTAQSIEAVQAHIQELVAGQITTDELYASMAQIASAQIGEADIDHASIKQLAAQVAEIAEAQIEHADIGTAQIDDAYIGTLAAALATIAHATIEEAQIHEALVDWAGIDNLTAQAAAIAKANVGSVTINSANIDWAAVGALAADVAEISQARIDQAAIDQATIARVSAEVADAITLTAHNANMDFATAQRLVASAMILEQGVGGSITIENLTATNAMFVQATLGRLTLKGTDGNYYDVTVTADGKIHTENLGYTDADIIGGLTPAGKPVVVNIAHIDELNAGNIKAQSAIITDIFTKALTAETISASEAFLASATIPQLYVTSLQAIGDALDLSANESIRLAVGNVQVGGRNLVLGSGIGKVVEVSGTGDRLVQIGALSGYGKGALYPVGTRFTISFEAKASRAGQRINGRYLRGATDTDFVYEGGEWITLGTEWQRYSYSSAITAGGAQRAVVYVEQGTAGDLVYIRGFQVETGTRATDWGPAPEDAPIAGRNLATGTGVQKAVAPQGTNNWCSPPIYATSDFGMALLADRTIEAYSVSFDYAWTGADTAADGYALLRNSESSHGGVNAGTPMPITAGSGSGHCAFTFTPTDGQREFGTTWMLSGMGTGNRDIQITVSSFKFEAGAQNTAWTAAPEDAQDTADDALASAQTLQGDVAALQAEADEAMEMLRSLSVGGANLIADSELITITGTDLESTSYVKLAEGLLADTVYTLSMESATLKAGSAAGMTLEIVRSSTGTVVISEVLDFSGGHQKYTFTTGQGDNTYEARLYAGIKGAGNGRIVELRRVKLETGTFATMWTPANADIEAKLLALTSQLNLTRSGLEDVVTHITEDVDGTIGSVNSYFRFDAVDPNNPKLILGTSASPMTMELTNSRLSFLWRGDAVAYFSDNKLYVTNVEAIERLSVGTSLNGHLDIVTTETGVGFLWR